MTAELSTVEVLTRARELISDPERWCQGVSARDAGGLGCLPSDEEACRWCATGALRRVLHDRRVRTIGQAWIVGQAWIALDRGAHAISGGGESAVTINDANEHATVLRMFDRAIELARGEGGEPTVEEGERG